VAAANGLRLVLELDDATPPPLLSARQNLPMLGAVPTAEQHRIEMAKRNALAQTLGHATPRAAPRDALVDSAWMQVLYIYVYIYIYIYILSLSRYTYIYYYLSLCIYRF